MIFQVKCDMELKPFWGLGGAPGFSEQAVDVRSKHRAGVVERKKGIKADLLKLPLSGHRPSERKRAFSSTKSFNLEKTFFLPTLRMSLRHKSFIDCFKKAIYEPF